ncbi:hypothetical protein ACET3Z_032666 [Daucus carota]
MAPSFNIKIVAECQVSPPPNTTPISLPLTFLDIPWLFFSPNKSIFFYKFSNSTHATTIIPLLKHSLALTLQQFSPFSGNISTPSKPQIVYSHGDSVAFTIAEGEADAFGHLSSNHPKDVWKLLSLVPDLNSTESNNMISIPSLAVQITIFGDIGMSIGVAFQHVVADERTYNIFMKTWASTCKSLQEEKLSLHVINSPPSFDRNVMLDPNEELETALLNQWRNRVISRNCQTFDASDMVQSTFVLSIDDLQRIKTIIIAKCKQMNQPQPSLLSAYVLACSLVWVCLMKCQGITSANVSEKPAYFGFIAGGITRLDFTVPNNYFGNCVAFGRAGAMKSDLVNENGIVMAARAIGKKIKDLDQDVLRDAKRWIAEWEEMLESNVNVIVVGSPKVDLYDMDFGLGKPDKIEKISVDRGTSICLTESRDLKGGMEVGIALSKANMSRFSSLFDVLKLQLH